MPELQSQSAVGKTVCRDGVATPVVLETFAMVVFGIEGMSVALLEVLLVPVLLLHLLLLLL